MQELDLKITLKKESEVARKFQYIKEELGFKTNSAVLVYLINDSHQRLNPTGNPKIDQIINELRRMSPEQIQRLAEDISKLKHEE